MKPIRTASSSGTVSYFAFIKKLSECSTRNRYLRAASFASDGHVFCNTVGLRKTCSLYNNFFLREGLCYCLGNSWSPIDYSWSMKDMFFIQWSSKDKEQFWSTRSLYKKYTCFVFGMSGVRMWASLSAILPAVFIVFSASSEIWVIIIIIIIIIIICLL